MNTVKTERSLNELKTRAMPGLRRLGGLLLERVIGYAANRSPTATAGLTEVDTQNCGFAPNEAKYIAKCARWAAIIMRDYGKEAFWQFVSELKSTGSD